MPSPHSLHCAGQLATDSSGPQAGSSSQGGDEVVLLLGSSPVLEDSLLEVLASLVLASLLVLASPKGVQS